MIDDLIEEIVRIYGMNNVESKELVVSGVGLLSLKQKINRKIRTYLSNIGLNEVITYSLLNEENVKKYNDIGDIVTIIKPLNIDRKALRQSQLNGLIEVLDYNLDRNNDNVNIFEIGHVYAKNLEENYLSILINSSNYANLWKNEKNKIDFYYLSGILKNILEMLDVSYELKVSNLKNFHPYQQAQVIVGNENVGIIAKLNPKLNDCYVIELNLDKIIKKEVTTKYEMISKYPNVERDIAVVLSLEVNINDILKLIKQTVKKELISVDVFDVYKGEHIEKGLMSVAFRMVFNDKEKTLESASVDKLVGKIVKRIEFEYQGKIRG